jgi:Acetyltransferase (GNAT) family.
MMQPYVNIAYENTLSLVGTIQDKGRERIIAEARYSGTANNDDHEMAFVVDDEYGGRGIAKFLLNYLISIARERKIKKLSASIMPQNLRMAKVFGAAEVLPVILEEKGNMQYIFGLPPVT